MAIQMCKKIDARKFYIPSRSYVSKLRGAVDGGYMCTVYSKLKEWMKEGVAIYPMIDSSPQGGRNNELSYTSIVRTRDFPGLWQSMLAVSDRLVVT